MTTTAAPDWTIGERLRSARRRAGLKQAEAARQVGVSRTTISNWEVGLAEPQIGHAAQMATLYGVALDWIASGRQAPAVSVTRQDSDPPIIFGSDSEPAVRAVAVRPQRLTRWELEQRRWCALNPPAAA